MTASEFGEELEYLARLLETGGNRDVPRSAIPSYFSVQAVNASELGAEIVAVDLRWIANRYAEMTASIRTDATNLLRGHIAKFAD